MKIVIEADPEVIKEIVGRYADKITVNRSRLASLFGFRQHDAMTAWREAERLDASAVGKEHRIPLYVPPASSAMTPPPPPTPRRVVM